MKAKCIQTKLNESNESQVHSNKAIESNKSQVHLTKTK